MSSLLTNASAMTALQTLAQTNKNLATTQNRIATGERVSTAADNASYWAIATSMKSQNVANSSVKDAMGIGQAVVDTAATSLNEAIDIAKEIQARLVAKAQPGNDAAKIDAEIDEMKAQIAAIAKNATFEGINLLDGDSADDLEVVASISDGVIDTIDVARYDLAGALDDLDGAADPEADLLAINSAIDEMMTHAAKFGASSQRIESQQKFTQNLMDAIDRGIGQLVDADMNAESARLSALQTQQQLGIQALSIANSNAQSILSLFR